ncbi:MAG: beta-propeller domain-containing protein [Woeseia sp.]
MNRWLSGSLLACSCLILAACGSGTPVNTEPVPPIEGLLRKVTDPADLEASIKSGFTVMRSPEEIALSGAADGNFTGTYTQEKNVDEFDAVRYDGTHLYVAPRRYLHCCYILAADGAIGTPNDPVRSIRILATDPANGAAELQGSIPLEDGVSVQGMYLSNERMFALTGTSVYGSYGGFWADIAIWAPEQLGYRIYDVADPASPRLEIDATIDGVFVESRRIGDTVYIVSRYAPWIDGLEYNVTTPGQQAHNQALLAGVPLDELLPKITVNGVMSTLVAPERCYITNAADVAGYPVITSITAVPVNDPTAFTTTCYNDDAYGAYVSQNALYFTQIQSQASLGQTLTRIHKFALSGTTVSYRGSAEIEGQVWRGGQADFRMSEHNGDLRLLASQFDWTNPDFVDHKLYVLRESALRPALDVVSELPNDRRPEEIGKPNEALYGVRFLGDRVYAVTFEQIDPLYAIDLSDPADPFIAGELTITGFSDFLHPVNDDLLLGLGTGGNGGIKLEMFDVSNITQPLSRGSALLGGRGSYSEARYDRHAFTYQADINGVDRFTIPAEIYASDGSFRHVESGLFLFEIRDKNRPALASLNSAGSIVPPRDAITTPHVSRSRAFIHNDTVYYIRDETVWAAFWHSPTVVNGPF